MSMELRSGGMCDGWMDGDGGGAVAVAVELGILLWDNYPGSYSLRDLLSA